MERHVAGDAQMRVFAEEFVRSLPITQGLATVVALSGDLGAGKTTSAQGLAAVLGVEEHVSSPTFVLENIYPLEGQSWHRLVHIDAYRLEGSGELAPLGWDMLVADTGNLILIEWPEQVADAIPESAVRVRIDDAGAEARTITVTYGS